MFRLIFFAQAIVYLLLIPTIHDYMDTVYRPPLFISIFAVAFLVAGFHASKFFRPTRSNIRITPDPATFAELKSRGVVPLGVAFLAMLYIYVSWTNGLWNRRQGSEVMADIFGNLPLIELAILRIYEISFIPIAVVYLFGYNSQASRLIIIFVLLASLPFMGIQDSRGRILVISMCLLSFVRINSFRSFIVKNVKIFLFMLLAIGTFIYVSAQRLNSYARVDDYLFNEVVRRLDGLNLVSELRDYGYINYLGSFDSAMFGPLISRIPFIEAGRIAKLEGITSTKQYFLKSLLNTRRIDDSNSIILDPLYFGGLLGLAIAFVALGYLIAKFDRYVAEGKLFSSHIGITLSLAFITSFVTIEVDYFGALTSFLQNFFILFVVMRLMLHTPEHAPIGLGRRVFFNSARNSIPLSSQAL